MIVAITGGTGFIGRKLAVRHLKMGDTVRLLTRRGNKSCDLLKRVRIFTGDLTGKLDKLNSFVNNADILYHCAAELNHTKLMYNTHVMGTRNLIEVCKGNIGRWVQLSSVGVYKKQQGGCIDEIAPIDPIGEYEKTKFISDQLVMKANIDGEISATILRPSNVYGPDMRTGYMFQWIKMIDLGLFFFIGKPGAVANYIHVENVVDALGKCADNPGAVGHIFNVSEKMSMEKFVGIIANSLNRQPPVLRMPRKMAEFISVLSQVHSSFPLTRSRIEALTGDTFYSNAKIQQKLGFSNKITLEQGLRQMVDAYKAHRKTLLK